MGTKGTQSVVIQWKKSCKTFNQIVAVTRGSRMPSDKDAYNSGLINYQKRCLPSRNKRRKLKIIFFM